MKKLFLLFIVVAVFAGCSKDEAVTPLDSANGKAHLKDYAQTVPLMAGQFTEVGILTYFDPEDGTGMMTITYDLTGGWTMSESHLYAGDECDLPHNGPGAPKIGKFTYQTTHDPAVTTFTYTVPAGDPNSQEPFSIAAHCVVNNPNGGDETGWAAGDETFSDKGWGSYIYNFYNDENYIKNELYGIQYDDAGNLILVLIDGNNTEANVILTEGVSSTGSVVAAAFDPVSGNLFFVVDNILFVNDMNSDELSAIIGALPGLPISGVFLNGNYYYIDGDPLSTNYMEIIEVMLSFDPNTGLWSMTINDDFSGAIPYDLDIIDLATDGTDIYFIGLNDGGTPDNGDDDTVEMFTYTFIDSSYFLFPNPIDLSPDGHIAYGADGLLYAIDINSSGYNVLWIVDTETGGTDPVDPIDDIIKDGDDNPLENPFSDFVDGF